MRLLTLDIAGKQTDVLLITGQTALPTGVGG